MEAAGTFIDRSAQSLPSSVDPVLKAMSDLRAESANLKTSYENRWADNLRLSLGIWKGTDTNVSRVRRSEKTYFRKIWATKKRFVAALWKHLLSDPNNVVIEGRDKVNDMFKAGVLQHMFNYRRDQLTNTKHLQLKHMNAFEDILDYGWCVGKFGWDYDPQNGIDEPTYTLWPPENAYPDFNADTPSDMKYIIFESYLSYDQLVSRGYQNVEMCQPEGIPYNIVRSTRYHNQQDPTVKMGENSYPAASFAPEQEKKKTEYKVWECFYREGSKNMYCVTNGDRVVLVPPVDSPFGSVVPAVIGLCLNIPHRLIGEGLAEPLEGPQESYNYNLNSRKDNIALCINAPTVVNRFANIDLGSLVNVQPGGVVLTDDPSENAVRKLPMGDVTQSSYAEAGADESMMQEMSGINAEISGGSKSDKATVAQINYMEGNEKLAYFTTVVCETYWRDWNYKFIYLIQRLETDQHVFRVANASFKQAEGINFAPYVDKVDDFDADISIILGSQLVGRSQDLQNTLLIIDRANMYNQQLMGMLQAGVMPPQFAQFINISALIEDTLGYLGKRPVFRYLIPAIPPQQPSPPPVVNQGMAGMTTPQQGNMDINAQPNQFDMKIPGTPNVAARSLQ